MKEPAKLRLKKIVNRITANMKGMLAIFQIPEHTIMRIVKEGHVRFNKFGDHKQAPIVFRVRDMDEYLKRTAQTCTQID